MTGSRPRLPRHVPLYLPGGGPAVFWPMSLKELGFLFSGVVLWTFVSLRGGFAVAATIFPEPTPDRLWVIGCVFLAGGLVVRWTLMRCIPADVQGRWDTYERYLEDLDDYKRRDPARLRTSTPIEKT